jgi:hypothetical protein
MPTCNRFQTTVESETLTLQQRRNGKKSREALSGLALHPETLCYRVVRLIRPQCPSTVSTQMSFIAEFRNATKRIKKTASNNEFLFGNISVGAVAGAVVVGVIDPHLSVPSLVSSR